MVWRIFSQGQQEASDILECIKSKTKSESHVRTLCHLENGLRGRNLEDRIKKSSLKA